MKGNLPFRAWFYFRQGWATYFAFILSAVNTMTITYYLAIDNLSFLKDVFPTFAIYVVTMSVIGIPMLITAGYIHYKRSSAVSEEIEVSVEANPYNYKIAPGWNTEVVFPLYSFMTKILIKLSQNEKLSAEEIEQAKQLQDKIDSLLQGNYIGDFWKVTRNERKLAKKNKSK